MKSSLFCFRICLFISLVTLTLALNAQQPPTAPAAPEKPAASDAAAAPEKPAAAETPAAPANPSADPTTERTEAAAEKPATRSIELGVEHDEKGTRPRIRHNGSGDIPFGDHYIPKGGRSQDAVSVFGSTTIDGDVATDAVSVMGNTTIGREGTVGGDAVAVLGALISSGSIKQDAVSVLGGSVIDGHVGGDAVCVLGDMTLGPKAVIDGDLVVVIGKLNKHADAIVRGNQVDVPLLGGWKNIEWLTTWVKRCLFLGRPLAFGPNLGWAWGVAFAFLAFYLVLALLFGRGIDRCIETLETRPGLSVLASVLTVLVTPIAIILLAITVVGALLIPFLGMGLLLANLFGKAVMLAWIGRRLARLAGSRSLPAFVAVLIGGLIVMLLYTIWGSFLLYKLLSWLGLGVTVYTIVLAMRRDKPSPAAPGPGIAAPPPMPPIVPLPSVKAAAVPTPGLAPTPTMSSGFVGSGSTMPPSGEPAMPAPPTLGAFPEPPANPPLPVMPTASLPPIALAASLPPTFTPPPVSPAPTATTAGPLPAAVPISAATLPRAGFGIRLAAMLLDLLLIAMILGFWSHSMPRALRFNPFPQGLLLTLAVYAAVMWKHKGTTIGGVVCGLKVVRIDQREIDWTTAIVRAVSCFLSLCAAGLGFIWVAFDDDKQSWHDKIAGTTVVRVPKGVSLL